MLGSNLYELMKIVILGAGQVGRTAAYQLAREEANEVTVVDTNDELLRDLQDRLDIRTVVGHASYPTVLEAPASPMPTYSSLSQAPTK